MTPNEIKKVIEQSFSGIAFEPRKSPDGWAFYLGVVQKGSKSTRIARAVQSGIMSPTKFKLAVTARLKKKPSEVEVHSADQVKRYFAEELRLWKEHFGRL